MTAFFLILIFIVLVVIFIKIVNITKEIQNVNAILNIFNSGLKKMSKDVATKEDVDELKKILMRLKHNEVFENKSIDDNEKVNSSVDEKNEIVDIPETKATEEKPSIAVDPSIEQILNAVAAASQEKESKTEEDEKVESTTYAPQQHKDTTDQKVVQEPLPVAENKEDESENLEGATIEEEVVVSSAFSRSTPRIPQTRLSNMQAGEELVHEKTFLEKLFSENLLTKIGIITLVLGIAFFVKYAIDQNWINEVGRVGIGILTGAILIGIAHKLRSQFQVFSALLVGGGIAVFYFTITLAFREYELFSQSVAFVILIGITILSVIFSLLYDRKELAIFSLLGGFASPLMISTGEGNYGVLFTFILILNTGMLILSFRKNWNIIGTISYILTIVFYMTWLIASFSDQILGGLIFAVLFFVQFYVLTVIDHFKVNCKLSAYHAILLLSNNLFLLSSCLILLMNKPEFRGIAIISIAVLNAVAMIALYRTKKVDSSLIYLLIAVVMSFVTLAIPIQLEGNAITMFWAAESVILLWLWKRSQIKIFSIGCIGVNILFVVSYVMDILNFYNLSDYYLSDEGHPMILLNRLFLTGFVIILSYIANIWLTRNKDNDSESILAFGLGSINNLFKVLLIIFTYLVIHIELDLQLAYYTDIPNYSTFRYLGLFSFAGLYVALLTIPRRIQQNNFIYGLLYGFVILYSIGLLGVTVNLRESIFYVNHVITYPSSYFLLHFLPLIALAIIIRSLAKESKTKSPVVYRVFCWVMSLVCVLVLSVEAENIATMMFNQFDSRNYNDVLHQVHTFVFPVLWAVIAMILMIWGLKAREVILRQISLVFFAIIIFKFYAYDVWRMSQAGRIISFVLLGVILLVVSFLQQKIKMLIKKDADLNEAENSTDNNQTVI